MIFRLDLSSFFEKQINIKDPENFQYGVSLGNKQCYLAFPQNEIPTLFILMLPEIFCYIMIDTHNQWSVLINLLHSNPIEIYYYMGNDTTLEKYYVLLFCSEFIFVFQSSFLRLFFRFLNIMKTCYTSI